MSESKVTSKASKGQTSSQGSFLKSKDRVSRQPLQDRKSGNKPKSSQTSLIGSKGFLQIAKDAKSGFAIFGDENADANKTAAEKAPLKASTPKARIVDGSAQTDISGDYGAVVDGGTDFYKELAEKRRVALDETLKENESLVDDNVQLRHQNFELKTQNDSLHESLEKASKTIELMESILNTKDDASDDEEEVDAQVEDKSNVESSADSGTGPNESETAVTVQDEAEDQSDKEKEGGTAAPISEKDD